MVGNTVLDNLLDKVTSYDDTVLVTMHRRENHINMDEWFKEINQLAIDNPELNLKYHYTQTQTLVNIKIC